MDLSSNGIFPATISGAWDIMKLVMIVCPRSSFSCDLPHHLLPMGIILQWSQQRHGKIKKGMAKCRESTNAIKLIEWEPFSGPHRHGDVLRVSSETKWQAHSLRVRPGAVGAVQTSGTEVCLNHYALLKSSPAVPPTVKISDDAVHSTEGKSGWPSNTDVPIGRR